ncbi:MULTISPECIES: sugar phosphate isomerase/epimerase [unclassified Azospirillum]|uniref:sugar phosphate isomerase/epimerase family protein n=1 Tax=unclassified Azospirillum TaxID=2630922 RepID=UPI000B71A128|nr:MULTISPECIES: sugar phosphate isomerase/epimerase [unclassified Azospirillum]SNT17589.1 Sugar phosphate isomerase/epimerase [Azospirillum sp. RU38E]SNT29823.1 Sugar phosphate isomerase/epimerase [Azospirillum sp. RU37A]
MGLTKSLAALLLAGGLALPAHATPRIAPEKLGLQLYSLHDGLKADLDGTLAKVHAMGLRQVELYPMPGQTAEGWGRALDKAGLRAIGSHVQLSDLKTDLPGIIDRAKALKLSYVGVAWVKPGPEPLTAQVMDQVAATYNAACPALRAAGIGLMYHIHGYELAGADQGSSLFDRLMAATDPACVTVEMDVFWVVRAGADPAALLHRYPDRIRMLHVKDIRRGAATSSDGRADKADFVPVGQGAVDWPALFAAAGKVDWFVLEDESANPEAGLAQSLDYLGVR